MEDRQPSSPTAQSTVPERGRPNPLLSTTQKRFYFVFIIYFSFFIFHSAKAEVGPEKEYFLVQDFKNEWLVYDTKYQNYVPYITEQHNDQIALSTLIDVESNRRYKLLLFSEKDSYLFINASMTERLQAGVWRVISIDSLFEKYKKPQLLLTFYGTMGIVDKTVMIAHKKGTVSEKLITVEQGESFLNLRLRSLSKVPDFFIVALLFMATFAGFLFVGNRRAFGRFASLQDLITLEIKEETFIVNRPLSQVYLLFILLVSFEIAYLYFFAVSKNYHPFIFFAILNEEQTLGSNLWDFLKISALFFLLLLLKYFLLYILGQMYRLESAVNGHYFKLIQSSFIYFTAIVLGLSVVAIYKTDWAVSVISFLVVPSIVFYVLRSVLLYFSINRQYSTKNLYLISYLCIAELIPLIIGIRYAL